MDIVTHALLGATLCHGCAAKQFARPAAAVGAMGAMLPDADILISRAGDPLFNLEMHRHFSHSLIFSPIGAAVVTLVIAWFLARRLTFRQTAVCAFIGYLSAILLDAMTSYGTHLFWPVSNERVALSVISIIDPIFSIALILGLTLALVKRKRAASQLAVYFCVCYLVTGFIQQQRALSALEQHVTQTGLPAATFIAKPAFGNIIVWRSLAVTPERVSAFAIRPGIGGSPRIYEGDTASRVTPADVAAWSKGSDTLENDSQRFARLSDDLLVQHPEVKDMIGDGRFAMLPTSMSPLWGITPGDPGGHARYVTSRTMTEDDRKQFFAMVLGQKTNLSTR